MDNSMAFTYYPSICPPPWPTHGTHPPPQKAPSCISSQYHHPHPSGHHCSDSVPTYCFNCGSNSYSGIDTACTLGHVLFRFLFLNFIHVVTCISSFFSMTEYYSIVLKATLCEIVLGNDLARLGPYLSSLYYLYWVGQQVRLGFSVRLNFLTNPTSSYTFT